MQKFTNFQNKTEDKEQKQLEMIKLESKYEQYLAKKISEKRNVFLAKYPEIKTLFEGWIYGVYIAILDYQQTKEGKGKLYYLFENITESTGKYKLTYHITNNNCIFKTSELKNFPKSYLTILKRHGFDLKKDESDISELITAHSYKLDETLYIHHCDYNRLNNTNKNLIPLDKDFFYGLSEDEQRSLAKPQQYISEKYKAEQKKKAKDVIKMEYRACDLYYNHRIPTEKIAVTLRNRLKKAEIQRIVKLYPYFKKYSTEEQDK
ncbi:MAG: hypothetical protein PHC34_01825 [Candidatus Gastranaerophilales bacterium]|nr:hypothetical protein [Candidatus Gastranaerophilales bacterium]